MRSLIRILFFSILTISFSQNILSISSDSIIAGETANLDISLNNIDDVYGFQMDIQDWPNYGNFVSDVVPTERSQHMTISSNVQDDGVLRIVGFSLTQVPIVSGNGPILNIAY